MAPDCFSKVVTHECSRSELAEQYAYAMLGYIAGTSGAPINPFERNAMDRSYVVPTRADRLGGADQHKQAAREQYGNVAGVQSPLQHVCEVGCECHSASEPTAHQDGLPRLQAFLGNRGTYVSIPEKGIQHGLELHLTPDTVVPGTTQTFRRRYLLKSLRIKAAAARWQFDRNNPELQKIIECEYLTEEQLNILLAPSRAAASAMQQVESEAKLDPIGYEEAVSPDAKGAADNSRAETLEQKVRQAVENFQSLPDDIRPSTVEIKSFVDLIFKYEHLFQQDFHNNMEPAVMEPMKVNIKQGAKFHYKRNI